MINSGARDFSNVARVIRFYRRKKGITQIELSRIMGYKNGQLFSNIERNKCSFPTNSAKELCNVLDIPLDVLNNAYIQDYRYFINGVLSETDYKRN